MDDQEESAILAGTLLLAGAISELGLNCFWQFLYCSGQGNGDYRMTATRVGSRS